MGCFSFKCKISGEPVNSDSFSGERCRLYLLENGKVVEEMRGQYDSYGRVFIEGTQVDGVDHDLKESQKWGRPWSNVCDLMFSSNQGDGIAAVLERHYPEGYVPTTRSEIDPDQGWGEYENDGERVPSFWESFADANQAVNE